MNTEESRGQKSAVSGQLSVVGGQSLAVGDATVILRASQTRLEIMDRLLVSALHEGQLAIAELGGMREEKLYGEKLFTQLLHITNQIANIRADFPGKEELQRKIASLRDFVLRNSERSITGEFGDKVRAETHRQDAKNAKDKAA